MKFMTKTVTLLLVVLLTVSLFAGCVVQENTPGVSSGTTNEDPAQGTTEGTPESTGPEPITIPIVDKPLTLTYWVEINTDQATVISDYNEVEALQELERLTGIHIDYIHPPQGTAKEAFTLMLATENLPDIIEISGSGSAMNFEPDKAIEDGVVLRLNELIAQYAPNFTNLRATDKELKEITIRESGNIASFPFITEEEPNVAAGLIIRQDWLEELSIEVPETIDEWTAMLRVFKDQKGAEAPFTFRYKGFNVLKSSLAFVGAYQANYSHMEDGNDKVIYGAIQPGFKDFLAQMNQWYNEGLIHPDWATLDNKTLDTMNLTGKAGAWTGNRGVQFTNYLKSMEDDPGFKLVGAPFPILKEGDTCEIRQKASRNRGFNAYITTACKNPIEAVKWFDYRYSEEISKMLLVGREGVTYNVVDGEVVPRTEELKKLYPDVNATYILQRFSLYSNPSYRRKGINLTPVKPETQAVQDLWAETGTSKVLRFTNMMPDEEARKNEVMPAIDAYRDDMFLKFVLGMESLDTFDQYVEHIKKLGVDEITAIYQNILDRTLAAMD